jgi:hypothetical protein
MLVRKDLENTWKLSLLYSPEFLDGKMKRLIAFFHQLLDPLKEARDLFKDYGGFFAPFKSLYFWLSFAIAILINFLRKDVWLWYEVALQVLPNLIGFTLAGYAILLAFGDKDFIDAIRGKSDKSEQDGKVSPYIRVSATMAFFVISQILGLVVAMVFTAASISTWWLNFLFGWLFIYTLFLGLAATMAIFFLTKMYDLFPKK